MKHAWMTTAALLAAFAAPAFAQGPGGFSPTPEIMAKVKAWQQWRGTHKHVETLQQTLRGLTAVEQDPKTQMTKPQARAALAVLRTWSSKPSITDAQALAINKKLTDSLTLPQLQKYAAATARRGGRGGGFGGGGGRPGGGGRGFGGGGGGRGFGGGRFDPASFPSPHDYNPLNPSTIPFARARPRVQEQLQELTVALTAAAR